MKADQAIDPFAAHDHGFLREDHDTAARRTCAVIVLCGVMMNREIVGGALSGWWVWLRGSCGAVT